MDYKQKYLKYKQKYLKLLKDQKGGEPFLSDILASLTFSYLFKRNQSQLKLIFFGTQPTPMLPLRNITLNHQHRLNLLCKGRLSILLAIILTEGTQFQLAKRILSRTSKQPSISQSVNVANLTGHTGWVHCVAFHSKVRLMATGSQDRTVKLWNFNPDGTIWNCVTTLNMYNPVHSVAFHPTLLRLAACSYNSAKVLDLDPTIQYDNITAIKETQVATLNGHTNSITCITFHESMNYENMNLLAISSYDSVNIWGFFKSGDYRLLVTLNEDYYKCVAFHSKLPFMATGSDNRTVKLWHLDFTFGTRNLICMATLEGHTERVTSVAFHPSLQLLATSSADKTVKLWHWDGTLKTSITTTCVATLKEHTNEVRSVVFHRNLPILATGSIDNTAKIWHLVDRPDGSITVTCVATLDHGNDNGVLSVAFNESLNLLATGSYDWTAKLWK